MPSWPYNQELLELAVFSTTPEIVSGVVQAEVLENSQQVLELTALSLFYVSSSNCFLKV